MIMASRHTFPLGEAQISCESWRVHEVLLRWQNEVAHNGTKKREKTEREKGNLLEFRYGRNQGGSSSRWRCTAQSRQPTNRRNNFARHCDEDEIITHQALLAETLSLLSSYQRKKISTPPRCSVHRIYLEQKHSSMGKGKLLKLVPLVVNSQFAFRGC